MKKLLFVLLLPCLLFAAGGDTLEYDSGVREVENNNATDSDVNVFYHPMKDSIQSIINGRLGNINIADDAQIKPTKIDSADTLIMQRIRCDTLKSSISLLDTILSDSARITFLKSQDASVDTLTSDTAYIGSLETNTLSLDTLTSDTAYISHLQVDSINILDTGSFTITGTGFTVNPTGTAYWTKISNVITVVIPSLAGTSNATTFTLTGIPAKIQSGGIFNIQGPLLSAIDGSSDAWCSIDLDGAVWTLGNQVGTPFGVWTASGTKRLNPCTFSYMAQQ